jgi:hypothetical protein
MKHVPSTPTPAKAQSPISAAALRNHFRNCSLCGETFGEEPFALLGYPDTIIALCQPCDDYVNASWRARVAPRGAEAA